MAAEKVTGGTGRESGVDEMNGSSNGTGKVMLGGGAYRWSGDAVPLKRRRVGLSNGGSVSDDGPSSDEDEHEHEQQEDDEEHEQADEENHDDDEEVEVVAEELLEEGEDVDRGVEAGDVTATEEVDEENEDDTVEEEGEEIVRDEQFVDRAAMSASMYHRGLGSDGGGGGRGRESAVGFDNPEHHMMDDDYDEGFVPAVPDSLVIIGRGRERERAREMSVSQEGHDLTAESDEDGALPVTARGGNLERGGQSSAVETHRVVKGALDKPLARGMMDTGKRKAADVSRNGGGGGIAKAKKEKARTAPPPVLAVAVAAVPAPAPASTAPRKKANGVGTRGEKSRSSTDNRARVTLERAREILAAVKAAMLKDSKQYSTSRPATSLDFAENFPESEDERGPEETFPSSRVTGHQHVIKAGEKSGKKRSRPSKGGEKDVAPPRRRKPKAVTNYDVTAEEKSFYRKTQAEGSAHDQAFKANHSSASGVREGVATDGRAGMVVNGGYEMKQMTVVEKKVRKRKKPKDQAEVGSPPEPGLSPGSTLKVENWTPPTSPFGLIQESLYQDPWRVLLSCMLLNKTAGRQFLGQMHKVIWDLFSLCPDAEAAINMDTAKIAEKVYSLGLQNKRAKMIQRFSLEYARREWTNVNQLHGIGKYAADAYAIFCQGLWREVEPDDQMLSKYWKWLWETDGLGAGFAPETS